jgi:hypothetical protein
MKRFGLLLLIGTLALLLMGMEGFGSSSDTQFPNPKLNYKATITDLDGIAHKATKVSANGKTALTGYKGKATLTINFKRIKSISVRKMDDKTYVMADLTLRDGKAVELKVKGLVRCYGITDVGELSVRMRDIKAVVFDDELPKTEE